MATTASRSASSRTSNNGSARRAVARRSAANGSSLQTTLVRESRAIGRRAGELVSQAVRGTRRHPYAVAGALLGVAAAIGSWFYLQRR